MRIILLLLISIFGFQVHAAPPPGDISACLNADGTYDDEWSGRITEQYEEAKADGEVNILVVRVEGGQVGGVIFASKDDKYSSAYFCGFNAGYYEVEGQLSDIQQGQFIMLNDEYEFSWNNFEVDKKKNIATLDLSFTVRDPSGLTPEELIEEEEDMDYGHFTQPITIDLTPVSKLPKLK